MCRITRQRVPWDRMHRTCHVQALAAAHLRLGFILPACSMSMTSFSCSLSVSGSSLHRRQRLGGGGGWGGGGGVWGIPSTHACGGMGIADHVLHSRCSPLLQRRTLQLPLLLVARNLLGAFGLPAGAHSRSGGRELHRSRGHCITAHRWASAGLISRPAFFFTMVPAAAAAQGGTTLGDGHAACAQGGGGGWVLLPRRARRLRGAVKRTGPALVSVRDGQGFGSVR